MPDHDEDAVRRLLAEARHDEPLPPDVAARLDSLLGQLVEARTAETGVPSLAARRQRRRGLLLLAAAAAVVAGIVVPTVTQAGGRDSDSTAADSGSSASSAESEVEPAPADAGGEAGSESGSDTALPPGKPPAPLAVAGALSLTSTGFVDEVRGLEQGRSLSQDAAASLCGTADYGPGVLLGATYDGTPAVLAYRPPTSGSQRIDLLDCDTAAVIRTTSRSSP